MGTLLLAEESLDSVLERIARAVVAAIPACDSCGVSVVEPDGSFSIGTSDPWAESLDRLQYSLDDGPCLHAFRSGDRTLVEDPTDGRWPRFVRAAARLGLRSVFSEPLSVRGARVGVMNLYSRGAPFERSDADPVASLAAPATIALVNMQALLEERARVAHLGVALESRDQIGQAKGILMVREGLGPDAAFELLRRASQTENRKLRDVAEDVVRSAGAAAGMSRA
ncbi:MAG TPA: GAF and ANTAR domain-containing protein [Acidimicrobiales bacterium]|nr:GAF and ANTAR domain-containing protein [Acidimicrobiales bacterium]